LERRQERRYEGRGKPSIEHLLTIGTTKVCREKAATAWTVVLQTAACLFERAGLTIQQSGAAHREMMSSEFTR